MQGNIARSRRRASGAAPAIDPKPGTYVRVSFGNRESTGVVVGKTITGRYSVKVNILGADEPVTTSYARDELELLAG